MKMDKLKTILLILCYFHSFPNICAKKNVLLILIDDLRHLSTKSITLPNINKMAANGAYFKNAFAQQALCAPSRNSLLTGRRPDSLRLYDFYNYWRDFVANFTTIPQFFKENGYESISVGKVFHPGISSNFTDDYPYSWTVPPYHPPTQKYKDATVCEDKITNKLQKNLICPVRVDKQPGKNLPDMESLNFAVNFLKNKNSTSPYFLAVGFHKPHIPFKFPRKFLSKIPRSKVHPPPNPSIPRNLPPPAWHPWTDVRQRDDINRLNISFPFGTMPPNWALKIRQSYYAASLYVDSLVGILMKHVDLRNTVVVLTSDHGWSLGENGLWAKYSNFDAALRVPLIFIAPQLLPRVINSPVELIDIFPTLINLAGISHNISSCKNHLDKTIHCFEGKNLILHNTSKNFAISQYPRPSAYPQKNSDKPRLKDIKIMGYTIRTKRYRYTEWTSFNSTFKINWNKLHGIELYDHISDQYESNNIYLVSKYDNIKKHLSKMLRTKVNN